MEYGNDFKSKYTTLHISTTLYWKNMNEKQKMTQTQIPPGGDGEWARKSLFRIIFITSGYNISKLLWCLLILIKNETKSLQSAKIKDFSQKGNQRKQAFLGILACLLGSQYDVHWLLYLSFTTKKQKSNACKL